MGDGTANSFGAEEKPSQIGVRTAKYRRQAAAAFPIIAFLQAESKATARLTKVKIAIDERRPLIPRIAEAFGVPNETVRYLSRKSLDQLGFTSCPEALELWRCHSSLVLNAISSIAPEHRPRTPVDWVAFYKLVEMLGGAVLLPEATIRQFLRQAGRRGLDLTLKRLAKRYRSSHSIMNAMGIVHLLWDEMDKTSHGKYFDAAVADLIGDRGLNGLLDLAWNWYAEVDKEVTTLVVNSSAEHALFEPPFSYDQDFGGLRFKRIDTYAELVEDALRMSNCMKDLYLYLINGERIAFSVSNAGEYPLAVFDISIKVGTSFVVNVNEAKSFRNTEPPQFVSEAIKSFSAAIQNEFNRSPSLRMQWFEVLTEQRKRNLCVEIESLTKRAEATVAARMFSSRRSLMHLRKRYGLWANV